MSALPVHKAPSTATVDRPVAAASGPVSAAGRPSAAIRCWWAWSYRAGKGGAADIGPGARTGLGVAHPLVLAMSGLAAPPCAGIHRAAALSVSRGWF